MGNASRKSQEERSQRSDSTQGSWQNDLPADQWTRYPHGSFPTALRHLEAKYHGPFHGVSQEDIPSGKSERTCNGHVRGIIIATVIIVIIAVIVAIVTTALLMKDPTKQYVRAKVTARLLNLKYSPKLADTTSKEFLALQSDFCSQVGSEIDSDKETSGYKGCRIDSAKNGSIILVVIFYFDVIESSVEGVKAVVIRTLTSPDSASSSVTVATFVIAVEEDDVSVVVADETPTEQPVVLPVTRPTSTISAPTPTSTTTTAIDMSATKTISSDVMTSDVLMSTEAAVTSVLTIQSSSSTAALKMESPASDLISLMSTGSVTATDMNTESTLTVTDSLIESSSSSAIESTSLTSAIEFTMSASAIESTMSASAIESTMSASAIESTMSTSAIESTMSASAIQSTMSASAIESTMSASAIQSTMSASAIESTMSASAIESKMSTSVIELTLSASVIESTMSTSVIESTMPTSVIESTMSTSVIESTMPTSAIESITSASAIESTTSASALELTMLASAIELTMSTSAIESTMSASAKEFTSFASAIHSSSFVSGTESSSLLSAIESTRSVPAIDSTILASAEELIQSTTAVDSISLSTVRDSTSSTSATDSMSSATDTKPASSASALDLVISTTAIVSSESAVESITAFESTPLASATSLWPSPVVLTSTTTAYVASFSSASIGLHQTPMLSETFVDSDTESTSLISSATVMYKESLTNYVTDKLNTGDVSTYYISSKDSLGESVVTNTKSGIMMIGGSSEVTTPSLSQVFSDTSTSFSTGDISSIASVDMEDSSIMESTYIGETPVSATTPTWSSTVTESSTSLIMTSTIEPSPTSEFYSSSDLPSTTSSPVGLAMNDVSVFEEENIELVCRLQGSHAVVSVQFVKDGKVITESPDTSDNNTVFSHTVLGSSCSDAGEYECVVTTEERNFTAVANVSVQVKSGEPTLSVPFEIVEGRWKETSLFICTYKQGIPEAEVYWSAHLANGTTIERLNFATNDFIEANQTDICALEATSQFYYAFSMSYNASSICCNVKQGVNVTSACETIYVIESDICKGETYYEHPYSCQLWIECVGDVIYMRKCQENDCYNIDSGSCQRDLSTGPKGEFSCEGRETGANIPREYTYPDHCNDYYICSNGVAYNTTCPGSTYFLAVRTNANCGFEYSDSYCAEKAGVSGTEQTTAEESSKIVPSLTVRSPLLVESTPSISNSLSTYEVAMTSVPAVSSSMIDPTPTVWTASSSVTPTTTATTTPIVVTMSNVTANQGDDINLTCRVEGNLTLESVGFAKDAEPLSGSSIINTGVDHMYKITNTKCTDSGIYSCSVTGKEGNFTATAQVSITVDPGVPTMKLPFEIVENKAKADALFTCTYTQGYPAEVAYWTATLANGVVMENPVLSNLENIVAENQTDECSPHATSQFYHGFSMDWNASRICCNVRQGSTLLSACDDVYVVPADICKGETYYEHPYSCQLWIECAGDVIYMRKCQENDCFNIDSGSCQRDLSTGPKGEFSCEGRETGANIPREYTYPDHCKDYYVCSNGVAYNRTCPGSTYFLAVGTNANCGFEYSDSYCAEKAGVSGTEQTTAAPSKCECGTYEYIPTEYTYPNNCTMYYRCVNGVKFEYPCPPTTEVNYKIAETSITCVSSSSDETYCKKVADLNTSERVGVDTWCAWRVSVSHTTFSLSLIILYRRLWNGKSK